MICNDFGLFLISKLLIMRSKILLLLTLFLIGFFQSCKKEAITETTQVNKPAKPKYIEQADAFLKSNYKASPLVELSIDASILYKLDSGRFMIKVPFRTNGAKNFVLINADSINGLKKGILLNIDKTSNTSVGEHFTGTITIREMNGDIKELREIVNGFKVLNNTSNANNHAMLADPTCPECKQLPEVFITSYPKTGGGIGYAEWSNLLNMFGENSNWYGYNYGSGGGGSEGGNVSSYIPNQNTINVNFDELTTAPIDLSKLLNCFKYIQDLDATYSITICAQLPIDGDSWPVIPSLATGHAFLTITKTNGNSSITQNFGFYP